MKHIVKWCVLFCTTLLWGQQINPILESDSAKALLQIDGTVDISSSGITNSFINRIYDDGFFTEEVKGDVVDKLQERSNRYQNRAQIGLLYATQGKKLNWSVELKDVSNSAFTFDKSLFQLMMYGNKPFTGQNLQLGDVDFVSQRYQSLGFGVNKEFGKWTVGLGLNVLKGSYFDMFSLQNGELYTAQDGSEVKAKGTLKALNSESHEGKNFGGFGVSFNGLIRRELSEQLYIELVANDIGFINWTKLNTIEGELDKSLTPKDLNSSLTLNTTEFTLAQLSGITQDTSSFRYRTAGSVSLRTKAQVTEKLFARAGVIMFTQKGAIPLVYINPMYVIKNKHAIGVTLQAGGFSNKDIVLNYELKIKEKFNLGVNVNALEALISPKKTSSQGLNAYFISYF